MKDLNKIELKNQELERYQDLDIIKLLINGENKSRYKIICWIRFQNCHQRKFIIDIFDFLYILTNLLIFEK
jgi:hypothetical protein